MPKSKPLYKRDSEFQKYIYILFKAHPELSTKMKDFSDYLEQNIEKKLYSSDNTLYNEIKKIEETETSVLLSILNSTYDAINTGIAGDNIEIFGVSLKKKKIGNTWEIIEKHSQFLIDSNKAKVNPLVLQNKFSEPLIYTNPNVKWNSNWDVPYFDKKPINERTLPEQLDKYPYLTVSDFLQPHLIRLNYPINKEKYFDGNIRYEEGGDKTKNFILPITSQFFDYFDTSDLQNNMSDGKPMFEMIVYAHSVVVYLRIPINGNLMSKYITFSRTYDNPTKKEDGTFVAKTPDATNNKGCAIENILSVAIYPFVKTGKNKDAFYRIMFLDRDTKHLKYDLSFYKNNNNSNIKYKAKKSRSIKEKMNVQTDFYVLNNEFDYIGVKHNDASGIIIPKLEQVGSGSNSFSFAIDFGTTNTHIEYKINDDSNPMPFEISKDDIQFATLFSPEIIDSSSSSYTDARLMYEFIRHELLPELINKESEFSFPIRTALNENINLNLSKPTYSLADFNIPFDYEKYASKPNSKISTNLKWSNDNDNLIRIERFFEELLLLIRTKVLLNNGYLNSTKLVWFYPSSMPATMLDRLNSLWHKLFKKYITTQTTPIKISESIAPYYYYKKKENIVASDKPVVTIDIGGETSDIVIFQGKNPTLLTSIRFAANAIFGDAYGGSPKNNGFVEKYKNVFASLLHDNELFN